MVRWLVVPILVVCACSRGDAATAHSAAEMAPRPEPAVAARTVPMPPEDLSTPDAGDSSGGTDEEPDTDGSDDEASEASDDEASDDDDSGAHWVTHTVVANETFRLLGLRYRSDPLKIRKWNGLAGNARAKAGMKLKILAKRTPPPREKRSHEVVAGDTWVGLGKRYGVDASDLRAINVHRLGRRLDPGEVVEVYVDPTIEAAIRDDVRPPGPAGAVPPGGYAIGRPHEGRLVNGVQIPASDAYELRFPGSAWGTTFAVRALVTAIHHWRETSDYHGLLAIGAMSRQRGRKIGGHLSHQAGRDVDIRLPLREGLRQTLNPTPRRVEWWTLWQLLVALEATGAVRRVYFDYTMQRRLYRIVRDRGVSRSETRRLLQYPRGHAANRGLVRHSPGHDRHFHVRFRCSDYELECGDP